MMLEGRAALITGASQGLGLQIATEFVQEGASVMICARSEADLKVAQDQLLSARPSEQQIVVAQQCDIADEESVDSLVHAALTQFPKLEILVNNAGIYGPFGNIEDASWEEWKHAIAVNLLGPVYVSRQLMPHFRAQKYGKIINLSGGGATSPLPGISSYAAAKAGFVRFCETLSLEAKEANIDVNAIAPGLLLTRMIDQVIDAGPEAVGSDFFDRMTASRDAGGSTLEAGAKCAAYLASARSDGITGRLLSAVWDPWEKLHMYVDDFEETDIYTIRRIIPSERGKDWGDRE